MNKLQKLWCLTTLAATSTFFLAGFHDVSVSANNTPQSVPTVPQTWPATLITTNDDWSGVPGVVGFLGDYTAASPTNVDPRTLLDPFAAVAVDVIANQTNPDTLTNGGVAEFDAIANPSVALNGSGTADAPFLVFYLNTTGQSNIRIRYNARDLDASADNAVQQINTQFRVGGAGDFSNVPGGYIADATTVSTATQVTAVDVTLPAAANNQAVVEVRVMTTNAGGNDEWVGIDDFQATADGTTVINRANADFNGDGKTDYVITRDTNTPVAEEASVESPEGLVQKYWFINTNGTDNNSVAAWGLQNDEPIPEDFDGDGKDDIAVWRSGTQSTFYILQSGTGTVRIDNFGQSGDSAGVVGDYDGDGKADPAVFRCPTASAGQCSFYYRGSLNNPSGNITFGPWGFGTSATIAPNPGDFDGDGKFDFCIRRDGGGGAGQFVLRRSTDGGVEYINWGLTTDSIVPGDWDGDVKADFCVVRFVGNQGHWYILERDGGGTGAQPIIFGDPTQDFGAWGDYDGDGRQDIGVWRPNADPTMNYFFIRLSSSGAFVVKEWGRSGDQPVAEWNGFGNDVAGRTP